jgi:hypothetical protein
LDSTPQIDSRISGGTPVLAETSLKGAESWAESPWARWIRASEMEDAI